MDQNIVVTQVTYSALVVAFVNWLKSTPLFPKFVAGKTWLIRSVSIALSFAGGLGIHTAWTPEPNGTHTLMITGLSFIAVATSFWVALKQFTLTELIHQSTKPASNPQLIAAVAPKVAEVQQLIPAKEPIIGKGE